MILSKIKKISRAIFNINYARVSRSIGTKKKMVEPPSIPKEKLQVSGFGKFLFLIPVATFSLGTWQVKRKFWKENLIKEMEEKLKMDPLELPDNLDDLYNMEYQTVKLRGHFIHNKELFLGPRSMISVADHKSGGGGVFSSQNATSGYHVITPFKLDGREETILVNRGWVPRNKTNPTSRSEGQIDGTVEIQGIVRLAENRPQFSPEHKQGPFLYRDIPKMCSMTNADPYFVDIKFDPTLRNGPIGGQTRVTLRNEHLSYIITWYSLSAFTSFLWWRQIVKRVPF